MMQLIEEIGRLRQELTRQRKRIAFLSNRANHDELSTAPNRRDFMRELAHARVNLALRTRFCSLVPTT